MAEVFQGTPVLTSVRIDGPEGRMAEFHVAGQDMNDVKNAVRKALEGFPSPDSIPAPKKTHKRRTKAEIAAAKEPTRAEPVAAGDDKAWP
jgi:hypothetical protein